MLKPIATIPPDHPMRRWLKSYTLNCAIGCSFAAPTLLFAQAGMQSATSGTCAGLLADSPGVSATGPDSTAASIGSSGNASTPKSGDSTALRGMRRAGNDTAGFGIGGARNGAPDVILWVGVHADQVTFAKQPNVRVRLCWGGDTLRVVQRSNLTSPVVAGTTYRNVYVAVELLGRLNGQCLANAIGAGNSPQQSPSSTAPANSSTTSASNCAFLGGAAPAGAQTTGPPTP